MGFSVNVAFSAQDAVRSSRSEVVVIIDVLRCCSTVVTALANGATGIIPVATITEAKSLHRKHPEFVLAGERKGLKPRGFDLGNSPSGFTPSAVKEKHVILTTTNGTRAISFCKNARWTLIGAILNAEAIAQATSRIAEEEKSDIQLVLSGANGRFSLEDFICAGIIIDDLSLNNIEYSDSAIASLLTQKESREGLCEIIQRTQHAKYLKSTGLEKDVEFCCRVDAYNIVPFFSNGALVPLKLR